MFKGKKGLYILIPLNIAIWGFFIYRFYSAFNEVDEFIPTEEKANFTVEELKDSITYRLALNYKDPFLKDVEKPKYNSNGNNNVTANNQNATKLKTSAKTPTVEIVKPATDIKYLGLVKNNTTGNSTALIYINGQSHLVKNGDVINGIIVKNISSTSVELKEGKTIFNITKN